MAEIRELEAKLEKYEARALKEKKDKRETSKLADGTVANDESDDDDVEWFTDVSPDAVEARRVAALGNKGE